MSFGRSVVQQEAEALSRLALSFPETFPQAIQQLRSIKGKVVCTGVGKSGHVARKVAATLSSTGTSSFFLHPTEGLHGDLGALSSADGLLIFSHFGETLELLQFVRHSQVGSRILITSQKKSSLAFCCDVILRFPELIEACPLGLAPTTSTMMMMSLGDALALTLSSLKDFSTDQYQRLHPSGALGYRLLTVDQVMRVPAPLLPKESSGHEIIAAMVHHRAGCVGLVDRQGRLCGMITQAHMSSLLHGRVTDPVEAIEIPPTIRISEALSLMTQKQVSSLFVVADRLSIQGIFCQEDGLMRKYEDF